MQGTFDQAVTPYTGPRPSPARRWAPFVIAMALILAFTNAALMILNLTERHYQQQRVAGQFVSVSTIHDTVSVIKTVSRLAIALDVVFLVVAIVWATKRRSRSRLAMGGEASVEVAFRSVSKVLYAAFLGAIVVSLLLTQAATSAAHNATTANQFVHYRTDLALNHAVRIFLWVLYAALVIKATRLQDRREALPIPAPPPAPPASYTPPPNSPSTPPMWTPPPAPNP